MTIASMVLLASLLASQAPPTPEVPVLDAKLGKCSATFTVKDAGGAPVYLALVHTRVRYGAMGIKRMDIEVGTNSEGKAVIKGLPDKARPIAYDIQKDGKKAAAAQDVEKTCDATLDVTLP